MDEALCKELVPPKRKIRNAKQEVSQGDRLIYAGTWLGFKTRVLGSWSQDGDLGWMSIKALLSATPTTREEPYRRTAAQE